jgi:hypothetical protein
MGFMIPGTDFRFLLESDTTYNSPVSEELFSQMRQNLEELFYYDRYTGFDGTLSVDPTATLLTDSTKLWAVNGFANQIVVMTSGAAQGYFATVASNTSTTITCSGSSFLIMGAKSGDTFSIFYARSETTGNTHNGTNSAAAGSIYTVYESAWSAGGTTATGATVSTATVFDTTDWYMSYRSSYTRLFATIYGSNGTNIPQIYLIYDTSTNANYNFRMDTPIVSTYIAMAVSSSYAYDVSAWTTDTVRRIQEIRTGSANSQLGTINKLLIHMN